MFIIFGFWTVGQKKIILKDITTLFGISVSSIGWIAVKFAPDIHGTQRMNFHELLTCPVLLPAGERSHSFCEISQHLLNELAQD